MQGRWQEMGLPGGKTAAMNVSPPPSFSAQTLTAQTLLAFDPGAKRIGMAVGNTALRQAQPLAVLPAGQFFTVLPKYLNEWQPQGFVVGLPTNTSGQPTHATALARKFGAQLQQRFKLPVYWVDERYSSVSAQAELSGKMRATCSVDALAAAIILQQFFDEPHA